ncbi:acetolactate synthase AlsS [Bifidobacterium sp.]|jgi:acetolactate synthase-1/2/3 large subunit|uniref:acetolactate synthase AlsS n=1 Tax=Bifidobacterium sp. TaxID=41200 RepID=UPI0025C055DA|nr:acetolactate synthase AlsS [Bifidobacterium sp.]MCH4208822.1 acetolactate synthase AlsS [Bifidobacterium sp.]MCI1224780.1 acetolactate synthase AlsS [Bifidobacterium sp.]
MDNATGVLERGVAAQTDTLDGRATTPDPPAIEQMAISRIPAAPAASVKASEALAAAMIDHGIRYVFGIPGAKVDQLFETLQYSAMPGTPKLIITRNEQDAALMAAGIGRLTGTPAVAVATSGPGASNLATGLVTATAEGDPVIAIAGQVPRGDLSRLTHQSIDSRGMMSPITKSSVEVQDPDNLAEAFDNAYATAVAAKKGAAFISVPQDVMGHEVRSERASRLPVPAQQASDPSTLTELLARVRAAKLPVILAGMRASERDAAAALRRFLTVNHLPVVETFQGAGIIPRSLERLYFGRVGLFRNQPGDEILRRSDLVITVGYDPIEYEARNWNVLSSTPIVCIDDVIPEFTREFQPDTVIPYGITPTLAALASLCEAGNAGGAAHEADKAGEAGVNASDAAWHLPKESRAYLNGLRGRLEQESLPPRPAQRTGPDGLALIHPLQIVHALQQRVDDDMTVSVDVGSHYIWMARNFRSYEPRHLLFSNGMQTLGVGLPWAIAAALVRPGKTVVSVSGDGGFLFSGQELDVAVREHLHIVQLVWNDEHYDMVRFQEMSKYGKDAGVALGHVDFVRYAESFGAKGRHVDGETSLDEALDWAFAQDGPVVIDVPVDYSHNHELNESLIRDELS